MPECVQLHLYSSSSQTMMTIPSLASPGPCHPIYHHSPVQGRVHSDGLLLRVFLLILAWIREGVLCGADMGPAPYTLTASRYPKEFWGDGWAPRPLRLKSSPCDDPSKLLHTHSFTLRSLCLQLLGCGKPLSSSLFNLIHS